MDELPPELLVKILNRLNDSADVARCRVASKTLSSIWREVRSVNLICTVSRYSKSRSSIAAVTPFKTVFKSLIEDSRNIVSVSVGVDKALSGMSFDDLIDEDSDELYLTDTKFTQDWLPRVREDLEILSISDFWIQSCWRKSEILALISSNCSKLVKLEVKNAWLSVVGLTQMPNLRHLTLEFIRLDDDENLEKVNECFPFLQVLNLIGVGGLKEPRISFLHLKSCHWTVSNAPLSLAIVAPNLLELELKCNKPKSLLLETPKLVSFHLHVEDAEGVAFAELQDLNSLELVSPDMYRLVRNTQFGNKIRNLAVDSVKFPRLKLGLGTLLEAFPGIVSLRLSPVTWSSFETHFQTEGLVLMKGTDSLKQITARVQTLDRTSVHQTVSFIRCILDTCRGLTDMRLMIHKDSDPSVRSNLISACTVSNPRLRWKWGMWAEGSEDIWLSNDAFKLGFCRDCINNILTHRHNLTPARVSFSPLFPPPSSSLRIAKKVEMATVPGQLVWEIVKRNNCFLVKQFGRGNAKVQFSKERNNLCNLNSYKHSGLANKKTVTIQPADKDQGVVLGTTKTKKQNKPKLSVNKSVLKKEFTSMSKAVVNQVVDNYYRPDLKKAALARLSVISKGIRVAKSGPKRRNRQA
ncbi:unnamed protein product [Microthlaspi erraticum]|uniref:Ribosomal L28e/Mak16 domain-containing protein n=1 Tax=Microthlaspi erraticum TaxID=1685480 RepID=A0A6D2ILJ2_9BRAS|nr:unnamed protein product [Microthlaspi erraticum]